MSSRQHYAKHADRTLYEQIEHDRRRARWARIGAVVSGLAVIGLIAWAVL